MEVAQILMDMTFFDKLVKAGKISLTVKQQLDIYKFWLTTKGSKMERYSETADHIGVSETTVRDAVREMKKVI